MPSNDGHALIAGFDLADDVLQRARKGRLGPLTLTEGDRLGPIIELVLAARGNAALRASLNISGVRSPVVHSALDHQKITGGEFGSTFGVFPLSALRAGLMNGRWDQWSMRMQTAAERSGFAKEFAQGIAGVIGELVDNVGEHSKRIETGIAAYSSHSDGFEFVVADAGIGVLESLRQNPQFGDLSDSGAALCTAMQDGVSSIVNQGNRGYGIGLLFRKLAGHGGDVRFRSGDHALTVRGNSLSLNGNAEIAQRAATPGLAVSILCRRPH